MRPDLVSKALKKEVQFRINFRRVTEVADKLHKGLQWQEQTTSLQAPLYGRQGVLLHQSMPPVIPALVKVACTHPDWQPLRGIAYVHEADAVIPGHDLAQWQIRHLLAPSVEEAPLTLTHLIFAAVVPHWALDGIWNTLGKEQIQEMIVCCKLSNGEAGNFLDKTAHTCLNTY